MSHPWWGVLDRNPTRLLLDAAFKITTTRLMGHTGHQPSLLWRGSATSGTQDRLCEAPEGMDGPGFASAGG